jgi:ABC-type cobalamin transport system permease subunit
MLLHAFFNRVGAERVFAPLCGPSQAWVDDVAVLTGASVAFAIGVGAAGTVDPHVVRTTVTRSRQEHSIAPGKQHLGEGAAGICTASAGTGRAC